MSFSHAMVRGFLCLLAVVAIYCLASHNLTADDEFPTRAVLHFPTPFHLTQLWVYNDAPVRFEALPVVFLTGEAVDPSHGAQVVAVHESLLTNEGLGLLLTTGIDADDERLLYQNHAPQYHRAFTRCDIDSDGVDEVLLTGQGGAGGTGFIHVFAIDNDSVREIYHNGSKFDIVLIDSDDDGLVEIWNAGIEFDVDEVRNRFIPREYVVFVLQEGAYTRTSRLSREEAETILAAHQDRLSSASTVIRIYD